MKTKVTGEFYREDAARIASEAARLKPLADEAPANPAGPAFVPRVLLDEPQRAPLAPQPAVNQNVPPREPPLVALRTAVAAPAQRDLRVQEERFDQDDDERPRWRMLRIIAWIVLAPLYVGVALAAVGINALFVKDLLGL